MPRAIASNAIRCQSEMTGKPVEAIVIVFDDGSTKVLCPAEKGCLTAGLCNYEQNIEDKKELPVIVTPEETDPIGSCQRSENGMRNTGIDSLAERDPIGSCDREEIIHEVSDEDIFG